MKELKEKKIGISVVVSGLFDEVFECCQKAGIKPPLIEFALRNSRQQGEDLASGDP